MTAHEIVQAEAGLVLTQLGHCSLHAQHPYHKTGFLLGGVTSGLTLGFQFHEDGQLIYVAHHKGNKY